MIDHGFGVMLGPISDVPVGQLREWRNHPRVYRWCRQYEPLDTWAHESWFESLGDRDDVKMYAIHAPCGDLVGVCGLTSLDMVNRHAEFSLYIAPDAQAKGYGSAGLKTLCAHGFLALGLVHIYGETFEGNPAAEMFKSVGFSLEGTRRGFYFRDGEYIDAHLYSVLAGEFRTKWEL